MGKLNIDDVTEWVENNIGDFHQKRIDRLSNLNLNTVLKKKNPYLFKAKYILTASQIVTGLLDAFLSSGEETIFGNWLEELAIYINEKVYLGWKSGIKGIDLEFNKENIRYIVTIKSGPNWANGSQKSKMRSDFITAQKTLRTSNSGLVICPVNGCCYGMDNSPDKGDYFKYCGQRFWELISGNEDLYTEIIEPLGHKAKERNEQFMISYSKMINKFTGEFINDFCNDGSIDWLKLVKFNSGKNK